MVGFIQILSGDQIFFMIKILTPNDSFVKIKQWKTNVIVCEVSYISIVLKVMIVVKSLVKNFGKFAHEWNILWK